MAHAFKLPLEGVRVLDFSHVLAGPMCTRLLTDLGAEVVRVETSKRPDTPWKSTSDADIGRTFAYVMVHRGKKSITIDLKSEAGGDLARRLASIADVIVENFSAGVMARLGLDYARLAPLNPGLIFLSMSGYGHDGPRKDWTSMNSNLQAYSGLMMVTETDGQPPVAISNSWMDYVGGLHGCFSVLEALSRRTASGKGCRIDLAQFECGVGTLGSLLLAGIVNGALPPRLGSRSTAMAPQGCYQCAGKDQWCVISVEDDAQWRALGTALGGPFWASDPRFELLVGRLRHHDEIDRHIEAWTITRTPVEVEHTLRGANVPAERMRRMNEIVDDGSGVFHFVPGKSAPTLLTGLPFAFAPQQPASFGSTPRLGEQTEDVLKAWLKLEPAEIAGLRERGALV
jgi:crotonobetainyl-CoA:carnitine CoA-transferase CaiB-like acyl-CoA transferase